MSEEQKPKVDFIGVGVNKSGSKWIYRCLSEHPDICFSKQKETHFFNKNYGLGFSWYADQYAQCSDEKIKGEFSPEYIDSEETLSRIHNDYPEAKILIIIREPIDRLRSSWEFDYRRGRHNYVKFDDYLQVIDKHLLDKNLYYSRIKNLLKFFPREQVHIMFFEHMKTQPEELLERLHIFLGVDPTFQSSYIHKKVNSSKDFQVNVRLINNLIFFLRKLKSDLFGNKLDKVISILKINTAATFIQRKNRLKSNFEENLDTSISAETKNRLQSMYKSEIKGLVTDVKLNLPTNWIN